MSENEGGTLWTFLLQRETTRETPASAVAHPRSGWLYSRPMSDRWMLSLTCTYCVIFVTHCARAGVCYDGQWVVAELYKPALNNSRLTEEDGSVVLVAVASAAGTWTDSACRLITRQQDHPYRVPLAIQGRRRGDQCCYRTSSKRRPTSRL